MGALYIRTLDTFNAGRAKTAFVQSLVIAFCTGFGIVSGYFLSRWGVNKVSFIGAALPVVGFLTSYFATSIYYLYGSISVAAGIGFNAMYVSAVVCVGWTFTGKLKPIVLSLQSVGTAISGFMWPNMINASLDAYGLRGTYLIIAGICLHNILFAIIFANSSTTQKDVEISNDAEQSRTSDHEGFLPSMTIDTQNETAITDDPANFVDDNASETRVYKSYAGNAFQSGSHQSMVAANGSIKQENIHEFRTNEIASTSQEIETEEMPQRVEGTDQRLCCSNEHGHVKDPTAPVTLPNGLVGNRSHTNQGFSDVFDGNNPGSADICDRESETRQDVFEAEAPRGDKAHKTPTTQCCVGFDIYLYLTYTLSVVIHMSTVAAFVILHQDINVFNGLTVDKSDRIFMSAYSVCNILGRFAPIIPAKVEGINSFAVPLFASIVGSVSQLMYLMSPSLTAVTIAVGFAGFADGGCIASLQSIIFDILPMEKQAVGYGFVLTGIGLASAGTGPIFGSVRDDTTSYQSVLVTTTTLFLVSALLELVCLIRTSRCRNNKNKNNAK